MVGTPIRLPTVLAVGKPLALSPADLDMAATVTPVDVATARGIWLQDAPPGMADLLDATQEP